MKHRILLTIATVVAASTMIFGTVMAAKPPVPSPLDLVWAAISNLQTAVTGIQNTIAGFWDDSTNTLTASKLSYSPARTHVYTLSPFDFGPTNSEVKFNRFDGGEGLSVAADTPNDFGRMIAPVHLPDGAEITDFAVRFRDNSTSDFVVHLNWTQWVGGSEASLADVSTEGFSGEQWANDDTISHPFPEAPYIDNGEFAYEVVAQWGDPDGNNLQLLGVIITYTISEAE